MTTPNPEPQISVALRAVPITSHHLPIDNRGVHQLQLGTTSFVYFTAEVAAQWLPSLQIIANEGNNA